MRRPTEAPRRGAGPRRRTDDTGGPSRPGAGTPARGDVRRSGASRRPDRPGRPAAPAVPDDVDIHELDREVRAELRSLPKGVAERVAGHLVMAARLLDEEPGRALEHAREARRLAPRVAAVREAAGVVAYRNGEYAEALQDLRAVRRMTGSDEHLPLVADCERGLGRPDRALALAHSGEARDAPPAVRAEMLIVESGARRDMAQGDAAVLTLQGPLLRRGRGQRWWPRLAYAYADALLAAGRREDAHQWFARAADADEHGETDADERLAELDGVTFLDGADPEDGSAGPG